MATPSIPANGPVPTPVLLDADNERAIRTELADLLFTGFRVVVATTFFAPALGWLLFYPYVGFWQATLPALGLLALHGERALFLRRYRMARQLPEYDPDAWAQGVLVRLAVMGTAISLWILLMVLTREPRGIFHSIGLLVVLAAGSLPYSVYPRAVEYYLTPLLLGCTLQLLWVGQQYWISASFLFVAWMTLVTASRRFGHTLRNNIELRLINERLNQALQTQKEVAEEASAAKTRFLAAASHDLRQPVQAVLLLSEAVQQHGPGEHSDRLMRKLRVGVEHFANSVDEIMDVALLDAGSMRVEPRALRLGDLLDRVEGTYRDAAEAKGLSFFLRRPADPEAYVCADPALVWRIMGNLVGNAIRYTPKGSVMVAVRRAPGRTDHTGRHEPGWRIEVRDSGVGIAPALHERVFEEFFQVENLHRDRREGFGLGLAVARRLADLMGTQLTLRSSPGKGSVFSLNLPACMPGTETSPPATTPDDLSVLRLLVVDDDEAARDATRALLTSWGVQVHEAGSAAEAAALTHAMVRGGTPPHALLTDHWLPDLQSSESVDDAVRASLSGSAAQALRTAVMTGDIRPETRDRVVSHGWTFWQKPVRPGELRRWLAEIARQQIPSLPDTSTSL